MSLHVVSRISFFLTASSLLSTSDAKSTSASDSTARKKEKYTFHLIVVVHNMTFIVHNLQSCFAGTLSRAILLLHVCGGILATYIQVIL